MRSPDLPRSRRIAASRQPLYVSLAQSLIGDIEEGRHKVGELLPTEGEISTSYGVSRHTVRQALRELKEEGIITSQRGIGTRVRARSNSARFFSGINTFDELLQFVGSTEMRVIQRQQVIADASFAKQHDCRPGQAWAEIRLIRKVAGERQPMGYVQVFVRPEYAKALAKDRSYKTPLYSVIEQRCNLRIVEVQQEITAAKLDADMAAALKVEEGDAAMRITRYFLDQGGTVVQISVGHYPKGVYTQRSRFRAQRATA